MFLYAMTETTELNVSIMSDAFIVAISDQEHHLATHKLFAVGWDFLQIAQDSFLTYEPNDSVSSQK
mgnify:CR=1 FL=1